MFAMLGIPTMFDMQSLLEIWLVDVPADTKMFGCTFLAMTIVDMLSSGLGTVNRELGKIEKYTLLIFTPKLLIFPICHVGLHFRMSLVWVCVIMVGVETLSILLRIYYMRNIYDFSAMAFCKFVIFRFLPPAIISGMFCWFISSIIDFNLRFLLTYVIAIPIFILITYFISLSKWEKNFVNSIINRI